MFQKIGKKSLPVQRVFKFVTWQSYEMNQFFINFMISVSVKNESVGLEQLISTLNRIIKIT